MGLEGIAKLWQRSCPPIPARSRWGDPTMPPHHVKVSSPRGSRGWRLEGGGGVNGLCRTLPWCSYQIKEGQSWK